MAETKSHKSAKISAAGKGGKTEVPLSRNRRLDALTNSGGRATEVERSGAPALLKKAAQRLKDSGAKQKVLQVPQKDLEKAAKAMKTIGISGTVKNMGATKSRHVPK